MLNLINSIGVLLLIGGITCFVLGVTRFAVPSFYKIIPDEFKKLFTMQAGAFIFLFGLIFVYVGS